MNKTMLFIGIFIFTVSLSLFSQEKKILIVPLQDTTIVNCHVGITAFNNFSEPLNTGISLSKIIENKLKQYLDSAFEVKIIYAPEEIRKGAYGYWGKSKEYKNWIAKAQEGYDILILINNIDISNEMLNAPIPKNTSGFYSRGRLHGVYTTISFVAILVPSNKVLDYYDMGSKIFIQIKDFDMPSDKKTFNPDIIKTINEALIKQQDDRIKYFLSNTYLLPNLK